MRTLKFRQRVNGRFHYWGFLADGEFVCPENPNDPSDQFTEFFDCRGKEIYEGDKFNRNNSYYYCKRNANRGEYAWYSADGYYISSVSEMRRNIEVISALPGEMR